MSSRVLRSFSGGGERCVVEVGDDQRCAADLRCGGRDRLAGQHFVDAGHESGFAVVDVLRIERQAEHRLQVEPLAALQRASAARSSANAGCFASRRLEARMRTDWPGSIWPIHMSLQLLSPIAFDDARAATASTSCGSRFDRRPCAADVPSRIAPSSVDHLLAVDHAGGVRRDRQAGQPHVVVASEVDVRAGLGRGCDL